MQKKNKEKRIEEQCSMDQRNKKTKVPDRNKRIKKSERRDRRGDWEHLDQAEPEEQERRNEQYPE